jgi:hypothetical protein
MVLKMESSSRAAGGGWVGKSTPNRAERLDYNLSRVKVQGFRAPADRALREISGLRLKGISADVGDVSREVR